jgi:hypothetical protein
MPELKTPDGTPVDLQASEIEFAKSMSAPVADVPAPPKMTEADKAEVERVKAEPKRRGRPPKADRARIEPVKAIPVKSTPELDKTRRDGVQGLVQIAATVCLVLDQRTPDANIAFKADAVTLASNAEAIGSAVAETAKSNEQFARVVDKVTAAGPYAALVGVAFSVGGQLARNHGVKAAEMLGATPPEQLVAGLDTPEVANDAVAA